MEFPVQGSSRLVASAISILALLGGFGTCWLEAQAGKPSTQVKKHVTTLIWDSIDLDISCFTSFSDFSFFDFAVFQISCFSDFVFFGFPFSFDFTFWEFPVI